MSADHFVTTFRSKAHALELRDELRAEGHDAGLRGRWNVNGGALHVYDVAAEDEAFRADLHRRRVALARRDGRPV